MKNKYLKYPITIFLCFIIFFQSVFAGTPPDIVGESAILMDRATGAILYQKNSYIQMYPASTTKILTSILCVENMDISASMTKTNNSIQNVPSDSSHIGLRVGDTFSVLDGIYAVMLGSDNYVAHDLATLLDSSIEGFAMRMNRKARQIGATSSNFVNPHGYHHPNHYTTAYDLALIADYAFQNDTFRSIAGSPAYILSRQNDTGNPIEFSHTVKLLQLDSPYYFPYTVGGKTGFNTPAGRSLVAVANKDGMELVGVVLKSTSPEFFQDMSLLFDYGFENFILQKKDDSLYLQNISFSPWAKSIITFASDNQLIDNNTQSYVTPISKKDFIELLMRTVYMVQSQDLDGFSNQVATDNALDWRLIKSSSILSGYNDPLDRETAANIIALLLTHLDYQPVSIYPFNVYEDNDSISQDVLSSIYYLQQNGIMGSYKGGHFHPKENLTLEEGISIATKLYKSYFNSPYSYLKRTKLSAK